MLGNIRGLAMDWIKKIKTKDGKKGYAIKLPISMETLRAVRAATTLCCQYMGQNSPRSMDFNLVVWDYVRYHTDTFVRPHYEELRNAGQRK